MFTLEGVASLFVALGNFEHASRIFSWTDATRERDGYSRPHIDQVDVDRDIQTIVQNIGSTTFEFAYGAISLSGGMGERSKTAPCRCCDANPELVHCSDQTGIIILRLLRLLKRILIWRLSNIGGIFPLSVRTGLPRLGNIGSFWPKISSC